MPHLPPPPGTLCIHIYTYGKHYGELPNIPFPHQTPFFTTPCIHLRAPSKPLCDRYTGLDVTLSDAFFSTPVNEAYYQQQRSALDEYLRHPRIARGGCVVVAVSCLIGMHRSVSMAERMKRSLWRCGYVVSCRHLDLEWSMVRREERLRRESGRSRRVLRA